VTAREKAIATGFMASKAAASPPHITVSRPLTAPAWPPDTGASTKPRPRAAATAASSRATAADAVVWSTKTAPGLHAGQRARVAQHHRAQVVVVADAGEHEVGTGAACAGVGAARRRIPGPRPRPWRRCGCRR
jgi:hypothetical protein